MALIVLRILCLLNKQEVKTQQRSQMFGLSELFYTISVLFVCLSKLEIDMRYKRELEPKNQQNCQIHSLAIIGT